LEGVPFDPEKVKAQPVFFNIGKALSLKKKTEF
jgi:hypothetical protein